MVIVDVFWFGCFDALNLDHFLRRHKETYPIEGEVEKIMDSKVPLSEGIC